MFEIFTRTHFSAGHHLRDYPGDCEKPHGHNWKVEVAVATDGLDELGMAVDFRTLKKAVAEVIATLDHCDLNEHESFRDKNPSSENIAVYIFEELEKKFAGANCRPVRVSVRETDNCGVVYRGRG